MADGFLGEGPRAAGGEEASGPRSLGPPVFIELFYALREQGIRVSPQEWFALLEGLSRGLARESPVAFYYLSRALLVKSEALFDAFDVAFARFFRGLEPPPGMAEAIERWLAEGALLDRPLDALLAEMEPLDLEELLRRFEEKLREQKERHDGGSEFIGTHGTSPFGRDGKNPAGVRAGGGGGGRTAVKIAERREFRDYRADRVLDVRQLRVALRKLRDLVREGAEDELDLPGTVERTGKNAGEIDLVFRRPRKNRVRLALLMDTGGSMEPFARLVERLFSAASQERHWRAFRPYYFHNCVYSNVYLDGAFRRRLPTTELMRACEGEWKLVVVGDACMAMSELLARNGSIDWSGASHDPGIEWLRRLARHFRRAVWLNPMTRAAWDHPSVRAISVIFPMFELTLDGLDRAIRALKTLRAPGDA